MAGDASMQFKRSLNPHRLEGVAVRWRVLRFWNDCIFQPIGLDMERCSSFGMTPPKRKGMILALAVWMLRRTRLVAGRVRIPMAVSGGLIATKSVILSALCPSWLSMWIVVGFSTTAEAEEESGFHIIRVSEAPRDLRRNSAAQLTVEKSEGEKEMFLHNVPSPMAV